MSLVIESHEVVVRNPQTGQCWCEELEGWVHPQLATHYPSAVQWEQDPPEGGQWAETSVH